MHFGFKGGVPSCDTGRVREPMHICRLMTTFLDCARCSQGYLPILLLQLNGHTQPLPSRICTQQGAAHRDFYAPLILFALQLILSCGLNARWVCAINPALRMNVVQP